VNWRDGSDWFGLIWTVLLVGGAVWQLTAWMLDAHQGLLAVLFFVGIPAALTAPIWSRWGR